MATEYKFPSLSITTTPIRNQNAPNIIGRASITIGNYFTIPNALIRISQEKKFVLSLPSVPFSKEDSRRRNICYPISKEFAAHLRNAMLDTLEQTTENSKQFPGIEAPHFEVTCGVIDHSNAATLGMASIKIGEHFKIDDIAIKKGKYGQFVHWPSKAYQVKNPETGELVTRYRNVVEPTPNAGKMINKVILNTFANIEFQKIKEASRQAITKQDIDATIQKEFAEEIAAPHKYRNREALKEQYFFKNEPDLREEFSRTPAPQREHRTQEIEQGLEQEYQNTGMDR